MSFQEGRTLVSILSTFIFSAAYYLYLNSFYTAEFSLSNNDSSFWSSVILILIPILIVGKILTHILFYIISAIIKGKEIDKYQTYEDERDKMIGLKMTKTFYHSFLIGFLTALGSQLFNYDPSVMYVIFFLTIIVSSTCGEIAQFIYYRRGF